MLGKLDWFKSMGTPTLSFPFTAYRKLRLFSCTLSYSCLIGPMFGRIYIGKFFDRFNYLTHRTAL